MKATTSFKSNVRETWRVILVSVSWHILYRITAHPRGTFISIGDPPPTETNLLLLTTQRGGSLLVGDKISCPQPIDICLSLVYDDCIALAGKRKILRREQVRILFCAQRAAIW